MDALQELQKRSQASIRTTLPRDASRLIGAPLTHADGESESNSGATGPAGGGVGEQAAMARTAGKMEKRSIIVLQAGDASAGGPSGAAFAAAAMASSSAARSLSVSSSVASC